MFNQILFQKTAGNNELETPSVINNKHQNIYVVAPKLPADTSEAISTAALLQEPTPWLAPAAADVTGPGAAWIKCLHRKREIL